MKRTHAWTLVTLLCFAAADTAAARGLRSGKVLVYSRNVYLGADLDPVLAAQTVPEFLAAANAALTDVALNDFPARAAAFADEIANLRPHLIGLQEAFTFELNGANGPPPFRDMLADVQDALAARGLSYAVAGVVVNVDVTIPLPGVGNVRVADRDVILARDDVATAPVPLCPFPSADGCNYTVNLPLDLPAPLPDTSVFRGFVAVDATVRGRTYRFVNTHLEVQSVGGIDITAVQQAQAFELLQVLDAATPATLPIILVGDFNSSRQDAPPAPYWQIVAALYRDTWRSNLLRFLNPDGFTCCQDNDLDNDVSVLDERIDIVFVRNTLGFLPFSAIGPVLSVVVGDDPIAAMRPKWSADHAGPAVLLPAVPFLRD